MNEVRKPARRQIRASEVVSRPLNYTTKIAARQTVGECSSLLAEAGAARVTVVYEGRKPIGLSFRLEMPSGWQDFTLPVQIEGVAKLLAEVDPAALFSEARKRIRQPEHAANVAWRVVKDWLEAQLAIIDAGMASLDQVMLPYLQLEGGTLYEVIRDQHLALPAGHK